MHLYDLIWITHAQSGIPASTKKSKLSYEILDKREPAMDKIVSLSWLHQSGTTCPMN